MLHKNFREHYLNVKVVKPKQNHKVLAGKDNSVAQFQAVSFPYSIIEAFRLGQNKQPTPALPWFRTPEPDDITNEGIIIYSPEGLPILARWGNWIIRLNNGDICTCEHDIFTKHYLLIY